MGLYDYNQYSPEYLAWLSQTNQGLSPGALSSPTPALSTLYGGQSPLLNRSPSSTTSTELNPWGIGIAAGQAILPAATSILGRRREYPSGGGGSASLGMTRGADIPNVYGGRTNPIISMLLARYLGRR